MLERASFRCSLGCTCQVSMVHMIGQYTDWSCGPSSWGIYPSWVRLSECGCSSGIGYVMAQCSIRITDLRINEPDRVSTLVGNGYHIVVANPYWQNRLVFGFNNLCDSIQFIFVFCFNFCFLMYLNRWIDLNSNQIAWFEWNHLIQFCSFLIVLMLNSKSTFLKSWFDRID